MEIHRQIVSHRGCLVNSSILLHPHPPAKLLFFNNCHGPPPSKRSRQLQDMRLWLTHETKHIRWGRSHAQASQFLPPAGLISCQFQPVRKCKASVLWKMRVVFDQQISEFGRIYRGGGGDPTGQFWHTVSTPRGPYLASSHRCLRVFKDLLRATLLDGGTRQFTVKKLICYDFNS